MIWIVASGQTIVPALAIVSFILLYVFMSEAMNCLKQRSIIANTSSTLIVLFSTYWAIEVVVFSAIKILGFWQIVVVCFWGIWVGLFLTTFYSDGVIWRAKKSYFSWSFSASFLNRFFRPFLVSLGRDTTDLDFPFESLSFLDTKPFSEPLLSYFTKILFKDVPWGPFFPLIWILDGDIDDEDFT